MSLSSGRLTCICSNLGNVQPCPRSQAFATLSLRGHASIDQRTPLRVGGGGETRLLLACRCCLINRRRRTPVVNVYRLFSRGLTQPPLSMHACMHAIIALQLPARRRPTSARCLVQNDQPTCMLMKTKSPVSRSDEITTLVEHALPSNRYGRSWVAATTNSVHSSNHPNRGSSFLSITENTKRLLQIKPSQVTNGNVSNHPPAAAAIIAHPITPRSLTSPHPHPPPQTPPAPSRPCTSLPRHARSCSPCRPPGCESQSPSSCSR